MVLLSVPPDRKFLFLVGIAYLLQPEKNTMPKEQFFVADPKEWLRNQLRLMREFFAERMSGPQFATMQDGGEPVAMLLKQCDSNVWKDFEQSFTTLHSNFSPQN